MKRNVSKKSDPEPPKTASSSLLKGRMNLKMALVKVKTSKTVPPAVEGIDTDEETSRVEAEKLVNKFLVPSKTRTRKKPTSSASSSDSNRRSKSPEEDVTMPQVILPLEVPEPEITDQLSFMSVLGLTTHDIVNKMKERRSTRKRRNVKTSEKQDYHYGNFDISEVSWSSFLNFHQIFELILNFD